MAVLCHMDTETVGGRKRLLLLGVLQKESPDVCLAVLLHAGVTSFLPHFPSHFVMPQLLSSNPRTYPDAFQHILNYVLINPSKLERLSGKCIQCTNPPDRLTSKMGIWAYGPFA